MDQDLTIVAASQVVATELDGEFVMLDPDSGTYYGLNEVGSEVWRLVATPRRFAELVAHVRARFDVTEDACEADLHALIADLEVRRLVKVSR